MFTSGLAPLRFFQRNIVDPTQKNVVDPTKKNVVDPIMGNKDKQQEKPENYKG